MSNWCVIAKIEPDGSGRYILLGIDGQPETAGRILQEHYLEGSDVDRLLELGDLSTLGPDPGRVEGAHAYWLRERPDRGEITRSYKRDGAVAVGPGMSWEPRAFSVGIGGLPSLARSMRREGAHGLCWAYAWTEAGWLACKVPAPLDVDQAREMAPLGRLLERWAPAA